MNCYYYGQDLRHRPIIEGKVSVASAYVQMIGLACVILHMIFSLPMFFGSGFPDFPSGFSDLYGMSGYLEWSGYDDCSGVIVATIYDMYRQFV